MRLIATTALALALTAFGARAQTTTQDGSSSTTTNPAAPSNSGATAEDKGTAGVSTNQNARITGGPGDSSGSSAVSPKTNGSGSAITGNVRPDHKSKKRHAKAEGRSEKSGMHAKRRGRSAKSESGSTSAVSGSTTSGSSDASKTGDDASLKGSDVQRPAAPLPKDPGMSKPGDVTGQPTDTLPHKPADTGSQPANPPDKQ